MLYYELKKIWAKPGNKIAMVILAAILAATCYLAVFDVYYVNENGDHEYGIAAIQKLKAAKKEWEGTLTEEVIAKVIAENARINATEEGQSQNIQKSNIAFGWKQGFSDIRYLLEYSYGKFREWDYYLPDTLVPEDAVGFYKRRVSQLSEWLDTEEAGYLIADDEKQFLIERYAALETPYQYEYHDGWERLLYYSSMIVMLTIIVLGFIVASIFSGEFGYKADAVFYSSYHGRGRATAAKLGAGVLFVTFVYWGIMLIYTTVVLGIFGTSGADVIIQLGVHAGGWKSFYLLTFGQLYLLTVCGGYVGALFMLLLAMFVSARTRSTALAASVPLLLSFLPSFIENMNLQEKVINQIMGLLPDQIVQINNIISYFNLYHIGGKIVGSIGILFVLYTTLSVLLCPVIYQVYRKLEAK